MIPMFGLRKYFEQLFGQVQSTRSYKPGEEYERIVCKICGRICYNKKDLRIHLQTEHPDLPSTRTQA